MKPIKIITQLALFVSLITVQTIANAEDLIMMRINQTFPETMVNLQGAIKSKGYEIARVQRVDIGLTAFGYKTDKYRVVFFGKANQVNTLTEKYPELIPYLPLKISIFAENNDTIIVTSNPIMLQSYFKNIPGHIFKQWSSDIRSIFDITNTID